MSPQHQYVAGYLKLSGICALSVGLTKGEIGGPLMCMFLLKILKIGAPLLCK